MKAIVLLVIMMVVLFEPNSAQASNFKISSWALYDIGGHVDYKNSESSYFSFGQFLKVSHLDVPSFAIRGGLRERNPRL